MPRKKDDIIKDGEKTRFSKENQPVNRGRKEGTLNRSTILRYWMDQPVEVLNPISRQKQNGTVEDEVVLALVTKARQGDVPAIRETLDTLYGKLTDKSELSGSVDVNMPSVEELNKQFEERLKQVEDLDD
jgi:hypothetical protein